MEVIHPALHVLLVALKWYLCVGVAVCGLICLVDVALSRAISVDRYPFTFDILVRVCVLWPVALWIVGRSVLERGEG